MLKNNNNKGQLNFTILLPVIMTFFVLFVVKMSGMSLSENMEDKVKDGKNKNWWQSEFDKGMELLTERDFEGAESRFKSIIEKDKKIPQAYLGLGLLYATRESGNKNAILHFETAIKLDKNYAEAYYRLGMLYKSIENYILEARKYLKLAVKKEPRFVEAWIELAKVEETLDQQGEALKAYSNAVKNNPDNYKLYNQFINIALWHDKLDVAVKTITFLIKKYPDRPEYSYNLAEIYFSMQNYDKSLEQLNMITQEFPDFSPVKICALLAKINFNTNKPLDGLDYYWSAVNMIESDDDIALLKKDLIYLMNDKEYEECIQIEPLDFRKFVYRFWQSRDPNVATKDNERIPEHFVRLAYARKNFRRYYENERFKKIKAIYESLHPYDAFNVSGDKLLKLVNIPKALQQLFDLDDLGIIFVRHGEPDKNVTSVNGLPSYASNVIIEQNRERARARNLFNEVRTQRVPKPYRSENLYDEAYFQNLPLNLSWLYYARDNRPEMVFHFKKYGGKTGWIIEAIPYAVAEREEFSHLYYQLGEESFTNAIPVVALVNDYCTQIQEESKNDIELAMTTETSGYDYLEEVLDLPLQIVSFKGEKGAALVEFYYGFDGKQMEVAKVNKKYTLNIDRFFGLFDESWNEALRLHQNVLLDITNSYELWETSGIVDVSRFSISTGFYHYEIHLRDNVSQKRGIFKGEYTTRDYWQQELILSDILLSGTITSSGKSDKFKKGDIYYSPHMFNTYKPKEQIGLYFEIYNLNYNNENQTNFRLTCTLQPKGLDEQPSLLTGFFRSILGRGKAVTGTSFDYQSNSRDEKIFVNLDVDRPAGDYELVVLVKDLNSEVETKRKVKFSIL